MIDGIREERMHTLPNPEILPFIEERFRRIVAGEPPIVIPAFDASTDV